MDCVPAAPLRHWCAGAQEDAPSSLPADTLSFARYGHIRMSNVVAITLRPDIKTDARHL
jgi:hypothetical protein